MKQVFLISLFGVTGVLCRFFVDQLFSSSSGLFPWGTFLINLAGCFLAGCFFVGLKVYPAHSMLLVGAIVGFCGGFTTFSAYALQLAAQLENGNVGIAIIYFMLTSVFGVICAAAPSYIFQKLAM